MEKLMRVTTAITPKQMVDTGRALAFWVCVGLLSFWLVDAGIVIKSNGHATCVDGGHTTTSTTTTTTR